MNTMMNNSKRRATHLPLGPVAMWVALVAATSELLIPQLDAQAPGGAQAVQGAQFEVASIKPNKDGDNRVMLGIQPGGRFTAVNVTVRQLITNAFRVQPFQVVGGPAWIETDRFDITAKGSGDVGPEQMQSMMRGLLAERFGMVVHNETRDMPIYALMLARADGKLGPTMKPSSTDCEALFARGRGRGATPPPPPPAPGQPMQCGIRFGPGTLSMGGMPLSQFAQTLSPVTGRVVQDKSGLEGRYDFELSWTPDQGAGPGGPPRDAPPPPAGDGGGSLYTAIQEQLGLKLTSTRGPVDVVVVDKLNPPTPD